MHNNRIQRHDTTVFHLVTAIFMTLNWGNKDVNRNIWDPEYYTSCASVNSISNSNAFIPILPKCNSILLTFIKTCEIEALQFKKLNFYCQVVMVWF